MKKNRDEVRDAVFKVLLIVNLVLWLPLFMGAWDKDKPAASTSLRNSNPEILANWSALETAIAQDHEFSTGGTNSGKHEVITFEEEASAGASSTDEGHLQVIDGGSQPEMAFTSEDGSELQFTKDGNLFSSAGLTVSGASTFNGSITLGAGDDLIGSSTSDITINTNKFTVAGATGNTVIAGTLGVTGVATIGDGSLLATTAAPTTDAMITNKEYVDNYIKLVDSKANTTVGGLLSASAWNKRTVAEESDIGGHVAVSSSVIVLDAGTYQCSISSPAHGVSFHKIRLRNTTGGSTVLVGTSEIMSDTTANQSRSFIVGIFTIAGSQNLEIQHWIGSSNNTNDGGRPTSSGEVEIYTIAQFWKR
jgi:hypothetical protein